MTIGDFSRATRLSARALRLYHRTGLLTPSRVEPTTGYRFYSPDQLADAQLVRQLRLHDMGLDDIRDVLGADGPAARREVLARHLGRLEDRLAQTRASMVGLRALMDPAPTDVPVVERHVPATPAVLVRAVIDLADLRTWYDDASQRLRRLADDGVAVAAGPRGGLWSTELVVEERGEAALFLPLASPHPGAGLGPDVRAEVLPPVRLAVAVHTGPDATIGQTYAALGAHVARLGTGAPGPVRETYLDETVTEIGWPVT